MKNMEEKLNMMEEYLKQDKPIFINYEDEIDLKTFERLQDMISTYSKTKFKECFERCDISGITFRVELQCPFCKKITKQNLSKTRLFELLDKNRRGYRGFECEDCQNKRIQEFKERERKRKLEEKEYKEKIKNTYFNEWLNSDCSLAPKVYSNIYQVRNDVIYMLNILDEGEIKDYINNQMTYKMYLSTPYWQLVSNLARRKAKYKCQLCGSNESLNVHHKTYKHKGFEIMNMDDLIVLCQNCHQKFHEVI